MQGLTECSSWQMAIIKFLAILYFQGPEKNAEKSYIPKHEIMSGLKLSVFSREPYCIIKSCLNVLYSNKYIFGLPTAEI